MKNYLGYGALGLLSLISMNAWSGAYEDWAAATELMRKQDYKGAILLYDRAIASKEYSGKHLGQLYHMRGKAKLQSHGLRLQNDEALIASAQSDLDHSLQLDPGSHGALIDRGVARSMLKDHKGAVDDYTAALALKSNDFQALTNRCLAFEQLNRRDEAIADCRKALEINPNHWQPKGTLERLGQMSQPQAPPAGVPTYEDMQSFRKAMSEEAKDAQEWQRTKEDETRGGPELSGSNWQEQRGEAGCIPRLSFTKDGKLELPAGLGTQQRKVTEAAWKRRGNRIYLHIGLASSNELDSAAFDTYATLQVGKNTISARQYFKRGLWETIRHDCEYGRI